MKFLIVDDNPHWRRYVVRALRKHTCPECENGSLAVQAYEQHQPDWVLMDFEMPGLDGLSTARAIKARFPDARIALISQHLDEELVAQAASCNINRYIRKDELWRVEELAKGD
jgi:CheY-like chemotaxis protein